MQNTQQRNHLIFERILYQKAFLLCINYLHQEMIRNNLEIHQTEFGKLEIWLAKKGSSKLNDKVLKERFYN